MEKKDKERKAREYEGSNEKETNKVRRQKKERKK
jgi:hypothetical protein